MTGAHANARARARTHEHNRAPAYIDMLNVQLDERTADSGNSKEIMFVRRR